MKDETEITIERLNDLKETINAITYWLDDDEKAFLIALIDAEIARQSVADADVAKNNPTVDWQQKYRLKEVEREGTQNALDDARRKICELQTELERPEANNPEAHSQSSRSLRVPNEEIQRAIDTMLWLKDFCGRKKACHVDLAITALQALRQPVEPCEWCVRGQVFRYSRYDREWVQHSNFCPNCGRALKGG